MQVGADKFDLITNSGRSEIVVIKLECWLFKCCTDFIWYITNLWEKIHAFSLFPPNLRKRIGMILESSMCSCIQIFNLFFLCLFLFLVFCFGFFPDSQNGQGHFPCMAVLQAHSSFHVCAQRDSFCFCFQYFLSAI